VEAPFVLGLAGLLDVDPGQQDEPDGEVLRAVLTELIVQ
jgi:hypothetical protein